MLKIIKERKFKYIYVFCFIISTQFILGNTLKIKGSIAGNITDIIQIFILSVTMTIVYYLIYNLIQRYSIAKKQNTKKLKNKWIIYFLIIIIFWLPAFIAFCPVILSYDGPIQIYAFAIKEMAPSTRQPIISTLLLKMFYKIGLNIFNSVSLGMMYYSIFQIIVMSGIFAYTTEFIYKETKNKVITIISLIFYALYPINQLFPLITTKDVMFSGLALLFVIRMYQLTKKENRILEYILVAILGTLMLLFRNNAVYSLILLIPFIIVILQKNKSKKLVILITLIIITYQISFNLLIKIVNGEKDNNREKLSVITQAIARVSRYKEKELNEDEKNRIEYYFGNINNLANVYQENLSDATKAIIKTQRVEENRKDFCNLFIQLGIKYPIIYIDSFLKTIEDYWYLQDYALSNIKIQRRSCLELGFFYITDGKNTICDYNLWPELREMYKKLLEQNYYMKIPIINMMFQPSLYFYILIGSILYLKYKNQADKKIPIIFLFLYFLTCFLGPGGILRYVYINIISTPLIISLLIKEEGEKN